MRRECSASSPGQSCPGALPAVHRTLPHRDVANVPQLLEMLREHRIADSNRLPKHLELRLFEGHQACTDLESIGCMNCGIELPKCQAYPAISFDCVVRRKISSMMNKRAATTPPDAKGTQDRP
jgi:hypothetical protein